MHLDTLLCQQLLEADLLQSADNIGVYLPIRSEPDLSACYAQWRAQGRRLALPVVTGKSDPLIFPHPGIRKPDDQTAIRLFMNGFRPVVSKQILRKR